MEVNKTVSQVTERLISRSNETRTRYLKGVDEQIEKGPHRSALSCSNLAHGFAACGGEDKQALSGDIVSNIGIITSYNDMLSAHQPFETYPDQIRAAARSLGATAQVAQLGADDGLASAGFVMLVVDDLEQLAIHRKGHALAQFVHVDHGACSFCALPVARL